MEFQFESMGPTLRIVVLIFLLVFLLIIIGVVVGLAALPGMIARKRNHPQASAINVAGWLGLPTGIVWVLAMVGAHWDPTVIKAAGSTSTDSADELDQAALSNRLADKLAALESSLNKIETAVQGTSK
ncbi:DUF3302 domain-containing protein [Stieleria varia]|uniref:Inner membrane protein YiaW n=1 Tax=Stieleria varia TaxID=2528005 RepID=A0A5C6AY14_9BACT|nr:DUF3302 domain-containing protein [Stieleria varia]TWU04347.1 Inner membrane protein YiaW [Stieleria varia]